MRSRTRPSRAVRAFRVVRARLAGLLSRVWPRPVQPEFAGFLLISTVSFAVDLVLLALLRDVARLAVWASFALAYLGAQAVNFGLNKGLTFDAGDRPVGPELRRYLVVVTVNYLGIVLGLGVGLHHLGLPLLAARVLAAVAEVVFVYAAMRWVVFRR
ncbi:GtrA family protein [Actinomycetospora chiangmaiensis]|uniref:GtrA family protein n=1 Tax=Actinomycetospora chiangmaiensis TaxID=402650 RepID=UPI0012FB8BD1|nr:GtrA family protein [Actinomycetospora chiangmaiensis]